MACTDTANPRHDADGLKAVVAAAVDDLKAIDTVTLDVAAMTELTEYMVVTTGRSSRHVKAIVDSVVDAAKAHDAPVLGVEGRDRYDWVLIDLADVVVHVMRPDTRAFYALERLWEPAADEHGDGEPPLGLAEVVPEGNAGEIDWSRRLSKGAAAKDAYG